MGWLRKSEEVAVRTDPLASWGERAIYLVVWIVGPSALRLERDKDALEKELGRLREEKEQRAIALRTELRLKSRGAAADLRQFLTNTRDNNKREDEILELYRERWMPRINAHLEDLEKMNLYPPETLEDSEARALAYPASTEDIKRLVRVLEVIGFRQY